MLLNINHPVLNMQPCRNAEKCRYKQDVNVFAHTILVSHVHYHTGEKEGELVEPWLPPCSLRRMISVSEPKLFHAVQL